MGDRIRISDSIEHMAEFFAGELAAGISRIRDERCFSIALSGGSTPGAIFEYIALNYRERLDWSRLCLFWGDERCVGPESPESNFRMARETLLDRIPIPAANIFRIRGEAEPGKEADRYGAIVMEHIHEQEGIPCFDLFMLGLGDDGHTASIFPGNEHLFKSDQLFMPAENPYTKQKRITATGKLINHARSVLFLVTGDAKADIAARIIEKREGWDKYPASLVRPANGELIWLLDPGAASKLKNQHDESKN